MGSSVAASFNEAFTCGAWACTGACSTRAVTNASQAAVSVFFIF
jgi:hypothetical protein